MLRWQKAGAPESLVERLGIALGRPTGGHHHEGRKVLGLTAQSVGEPCANARFARYLVSGKDIGGRGVGVNGLGIDTPNHGKVVNNLSGVGQKFADHRAAFYVRRKFVNGWSDGKALLTGSHGR